MLNEKDALSKRKTCFSLEDVVFSNVINSAPSVMRCAEVFAVEDMTLKVLSSLRCVSFKKMKGRSAL